MQDTITCPACKRRLVLPPGVFDILAQCPSCQTRFPSHPAATAPPARPEVASPPAKPIPEPAPPRIDLRTPAPSGKPAGSGWTGGWGWLVGLVLFGILRLMFRGDGDRPPARDVRIQRVVRALEEPRNVGDEPAPAEELKALLEKTRRVMAEARARDFQSLFDDLREEYRTADGRRLMIFFDLDRMAEEFIEEKPVAKIPLIQSLRLSLPGLLEKQAPAMAWTAMKVKEVKRLGDDESVVDTRLVNAEGGTREIRWWLIRRPGGWRVYDLKDLEKGERLSLAAGLAAPPP